MNAPDQERWMQLWHQAGLKGDAVAWYRDLWERHSQTHRHYHNLQHIAECLKEFDASKQLARNLTAVELAIWFHDAIYDPRASDNEECSAALAEECLSQAGGTVDLAGQVSQLIIATKHTAKPVYRDEELLVDVDLSILGQMPERFREYEMQIRQEYVWVAYDVFAVKRSEILGRFLQRPRIYNTDWFFEKYEQQARINLTNSVMKLRSSS